MQLILMFTIANTPIPILCKLTGYTIFDRCWKTPLNVCKSLRPYYSRMTVQGVPQLGIIWENFAAELNSKYFLLSKIKNTPFYTLLGLVVVWWLTLRIQMTNEYRSVHMGHFYFNNNKHNKFNYHNNNYKKKLAISFGLCFLVFID